jgi:hypothetical protein
MRGRVSLATILLATKGSSSNGEHKERVQEDRAKSQKSSLHEDGQGGRQSTVGTERRARYIERQSPCLHFQDFSPAGKKTRWVKMVDGSSLARSGAERARPKKRASY